MSFQISVNIGDRFKHHKSEFEITDINNWEIRYSCVVSGKINYTTIENYQDSINKKTIKLIKGKLNNNILPDNLSPKEVLIQNRRLAYVRAVINKPKTDNVSTKGHVLKIILEESQKQNDKKPPSYSTLCKCIGLLITVFLPLLKYFGFHKFEKRKIGIQHINLAKELMNSNINRASKKQKFLTEQLFESLYSRRFNYDEILALINMPNTSIALYYFIKSGNYSELSEDKNSFSLKQKYKNVRKERISIFIQYLAVMTSGILCVGGAALLHQATNEIIDKFLYPFILLSCGIFLIIIGIKILWDSDQIKYAVKLEKESRS